MATYQYSLFFVNHSINHGSACIYQVLNAPPQNASVVAWLVEYAFPTSAVSLEWNPTYAFVWSQTGELLPGAMIGASQVWSASVPEQVTLTSGEGTFTFENQKAGNTPGTLDILQDGTIPLNEAAVGIGMAGAATCVVQAEPNITTSFPPLAQYWVTFGNYTSGQILNLPISNAVQVTFPANVYSMTATISSQNSITVQQTDAVNTAYAKAKKSDRTARWGAA